MLACLALQDAQFRSSTMSTLTRATQISLKLHQKFFQHKKFYPQYFTQPSLMVLVTHCITYAFELITRQLLFKNAISPQNSRQHQCNTTSFAKCHPRFQSNNFSSLLASPVAAYDFYLCECVIHSPIDQLAGS